jgi:hypothetical protein
MTLTKIVLSMAILLTFPFCPLSAQTNPTDSSVPSTPKVDTVTPSDNGNYLSDRIKLRVALRVLRVNLTGQSKVGLPACARANTVLKGIGSLAIDGKTLPAFIVSEIPSGDGTNTVSGPLNRCSDSTALVVVDDVVALEQADLVSIPVSRYGLTYGALLVPFKYHLAGSREFTGNASLGGYLGYRHSSQAQGLEMKWVAFFGATNVSVSQTSNGQTSNLNLAGVTYGVGLIGNVKNAFQLGVIFGADRVSNSAGYKENGKPWIAISLGYDFSN